MLFLLVLLHISCVSACSKENNIFANIGIKCSRYHFCWTFIIAVVIVISESRNDNYTEEVEAEAKESLVTDVLHATGNEAVDMEEIDEFLGK